MSISGTNERTSASRKPSPTLRPVGPGRRAVRGTPEQAGARHERRARASVYSHSSGSWRGVRSARIQSGRSRTGANLAAVASPSMNPRRRGIVNRASPQARNAAGIASFVFELIE